MAQPQNPNNNDLTDRHNAVLERLEALEAKNRMLKEEIDWMVAAKLRHYFLLGLLFYMLVPVPIFSSAIYFCELINNPLVLNLFFGPLSLVMGWVLIASQAMCEPLRELLEMAEAQEADRRGLRQEEKTIHRALERRHCQEQIRKQLREMAGRGQNAEGIPQVPETLDLDEDDVIQCSICLEQFNLYEDVAILACQHVFHRTCIDYWLQCNDTCPICRTKIDSIIGA